MSTVLLRRRRLGRGSCRGISEKSTTSIGVVRSWLIGQDGPPERDDLVIRWGCTANVESNNVLNTARAIHQVNDKAGFRMWLMEHMLTGDRLDGLVPMTYLDDDFASEYDDVDVIVRPANHSRGRDVHRCLSMSAVRSAMRTCGTGAYISEYIPKVAEYRVFVVQGRAVAVAEKTPANREDIAWNVAQGGRFDNVSWDNWPLQAVRKSIEAFNLSELDFGGVDVMVDADGKAYVIEINSAPSLTSDYRQECMAKAFDWIVLHGKERIPMIEVRGGYRKFIHPAVCDRAILVADGGVLTEPDVYTHVEDEYSDEDVEPATLADVQTGHISDFSDQQLLDEMDRRMGR